jgi:hypothetical protein
MYVLSWWLKKCLRVLSNVYIQKLQKKCEVFINRSAKATLKQAFSKVNNVSLSEIIQQKENKI